MLPGRAKKRIIPGDTATAGCSPREQLTCGNWDGVSWVAWAPWDLAGLNSLGERWAWELSLVVWGPAPERLGPCRVACGGETCWEVAGVWTYELSFLRELTSPQSGPQS